MALSEWYFEMLRDTARSRCLGGKGGPLGEQQEGSKKKEVGVISENGILDGEIVLD